MQRLSSNKAKKALEFLIRKRLGVSNAEIMLKPVLGKEFRKDKLKNTLCKVEVSLTYQDGKGHIVPLVVEYVGRAGFNLQYVQQYGISFAKLFRRIEKESTIRNAIFGIYGQGIFSKNDSIESSLVEFDLENDNIKNNN